MLLVRPARLQMALLCLAAAMWQRRQSTQGLKAPPTQLRRLPSSSPQKQRSMWGPALQVLQRQRLRRSLPITCRLLCLAIMRQPLSLLELPCMMGSANWCGTWSSG